MVNIHSNEALQYLTLLWCQIKSTLITLGPFSYVISFTLVSDSLVNSLPSMYLSKEEIRRATVNRQAHLDLKTSQKN